MPKRDQAPVGAPIWIDLFTSDPDASRAFYTELFGWKAEEPNPEFGGYWNFTKDDVLIAGGMRNDGSTETTDAWSIYLAVTNAQTTLDAATLNGAQVVVPAMPVADLGTMAVVVDPGGARIGMWQPGLHKGFGEYNELDTPAWFELHTSAYDTSVAFYRNVFSWNANTTSDTPEFRYTTLDEGDEQLAGIMDASQYAPSGTPGTWDIYFRVADTDQALARVTALGGGVAEPAVDTPYGRLAAATDPTGARFKLMAGD